MNILYIANRYFQCIITKLKLGMRLEKVCHILNECCVPWLQRADDV